MDDHQTANAKSLTEHGAGILLPQSELSSATLAAKLDALTRVDCKKMAIKARSHAKTNVAQNVADIVERVVKG